MKIIRSFLSALVIALCLGLSGCISVSESESASAAFGPRPPLFQDDIKRLMSGVLKDPYSAVYTFGDPRKGVAQEGFLRGGKKYFGWIVPTQINAKNSFGGYTGNQQYYFLFSKGQVIDITASMGQMAKFLE